MHCERDFPASQTENKAPAAHQIAEPDDKSKMSTSILTAALTLGSFFKTLYLFPKNDIQTMILPVTCIGLSGALTNSYSRSSSPTQPAEDIGCILLRAPHTFFWVYLNVLLFSISNQRSPKAILEDQINKPWRPLPAGRINSASARRLLVLLIPALLLISRYILGALEETMQCLLLTWIYNDLGGSDEHFFLRNIVNSLAYFSYGSGALRVATAAPNSIPADAVRWLCIISAMILTTMQVQDLKDQAGDRATNRSTLPLSLGDKFCRYSISVGVLAWSLVAPRYWSLGLLNSSVPFVLGVLITCRLAFFRSPQADALTYKLWSLWLISICCLPLVRIWPDSQLFSVWQILGKAKYMVFLTLSLAFYLILVRILRHRRCFQHHQLAAAHATKTSANGAAEQCHEMAFSDAQKIYSSLFNKEFPFMFMKGIQFALFRQYAVPSIASVLARSNRLSCPKNIPLRYAETEILFLEFALREWGSRSWLQAITRTKAMHETMRKRGIATEEDMLFTLATLATQPVELIERYEWRALTDVELCAVGTLYRGIGEALGIEYSTFLALPHASNEKVSLKSSLSGLQFYHALHSWQKSYEAHAFAYTPDTHLLATTAMNFFLCSIPTKILKSFSISCLTVPMDLPLRTAIGFSSPSPTLARIINASLNIRRFIILHMLLPRPNFLTVRRTVDVETSESLYTTGDKESDSYIKGIRRTSYIQSPYFVAPTIWNRYLSPTAVWYRVVGLPVPGNNDDTDYQSSGYKVSISINNCMAQS
ncbi:digeranylgeranylglyceryl phosphate synthase protein [Rutstroemia sp. NJR-2017a WRK4]|nr:digeranylgeranylglyceryl phosphate synthase protein [Rutstroemia sp. NJR-2017a WRK4]